MGPLHIGRLVSGGLITNYVCSSRCAHCLYGCGPEWPKDYIGEATTERILSKVLELGCSSVHIGGGEPLLRPEALCKVARKARELGVGIEYVETNSSWYKGVDEAVETLKRIKAAGVETLLISISPFHNEYIPLKKVRGVAAACKRVDMNIFPWMDTFLGDLASFDESTPHSLAEYEEKFGPDYLGDLPRRYSLNLRGRAAKTFERVFPLKPLRDILAASKNGCHELEGTHHFHVDLYGGYIPGLCSGLSIRVEDLGATLDDGRYPLLSILWREGVGSLLEYATREFDFDPRLDYLSKCSLCLDIRTWLAKKAPGRFIELQPAGYYQYV